jgi:hypothetical protein
MRYVNQSSHCRLTLVKRRSVAISDFFIRVAQLVKECTDGVGVCLNARCVKKGGTQLWHRYATILHLPFGRPCGAASLLASPPYRKRPSCSRGWRELQAQCRCAIALTAPAARLAKVLT